MQEINMVIRNQGVICANPCRAAVETSLHDSVHEIK